MDDVLAVVTDLFFQARIASTARARGRTVRFVDDRQAGASDAGFRLALVDLDAGPDVEPAIRRLRSRTSGQIVAFGPHVDTARRKAARAAGADRVLAKSKFTTELADMLNDQAQQDGGSGSTMDELRVFGERMERLGKLLQDPDSARRLYLAPDPHMAQAADPIVLDSADYLGFLAVDALQARLHRARGEIDIP